jgi:CelD/BcsL family acetyltransferase involved in cellulose biosynthesis
LSPRSQRGLDLKANRSVASLETSLVQTDEGFRSLQPEWDTLVESLDLPSPFHSWDWSYVWWKHFGRNRRLHIVVFRENGRLTGIAQLYERRYGGRFGLTSLAPIGWGNLLTEQLELLFPRDDRRRLIAALSSYLMGSKSSWFGLSGLDEGDLVEGLNGLGIVSRIDMPFEYRELPKTWEDLVRGLNRSMKDNVKYYPKLMVRTGYPFRLRIADSPDDVAAALPSVYRLHSIRAAVDKGVAHKDYLEREDHRSFLNEVGPRLAARGEMKVGLLEVGDEVVAAQIWLEESKTLFLYYSGYKPEWSKYSVAMITTSEILKNGIGRGLDRVEFLRGTGQFKTRWDTHQRTQLEVTWASHARSIRALLGSYRSARQLLRRLRRAT